MEPDLDEVAELTGPGLDLGEGGDGEAELEAAVGEVDEGLVGVPLALAEAGLEPLDGGDAEADELASAMLVASPGS